MRSRWGLAAFLGVVSSWPLFGAGVPEGLWSRVESGSPGRTVNVEVSRFRLDRAILTDILRHGATEMTLPVPGGGFERFEISESSILEPDLAARHPEIWTFTARGIDDRTATGRFSWTPLGFHALVVTSRGSFFVMPESETDPAAYVSASAREARAHVPAICLADSSSGKPETLAELPQPVAAVGGTLRLFRTAVAATGEFTQTYGGGTVAGGVSAVTAWINLVDAIYEREVAVRLVLVSNEDLIVYTDGTNDPYTNGDPASMDTENQSNLTAVIGAANYDVGHVLGTGFSGRSFYGLCSNPSVKGSAASNVAGALGNSTFTYLIAHEIGHQFHASHTFNGTSGSCGGGNRVAATAYEPGSGSTIMSYAGVCDPENVAPDRDAYFHTGSFEQMAAAIAAACGSSQSTGNTPPTVSAGPAFTIPMGTPFTLTASGSDPDGDALTYCWEEVDAGAASPPDTDDGTRAIFRSFPPTASPTRVFPQISDVLANSPTFGEWLPATNRTLHFRVTARDNRSGGGGVADASTQVTVTTAAGPFAVTAPNTAVTWKGNTTQSVTWNVAGTTAPPVSCASVDVLLSTDGGASFPVVLAAGAPNNGSASVAVPNTPTSTARVEVRAVGNVFFDISDVDFSIVAGIGVSPATLPNATVNVSYSQQLIGTGGSGPYAFAVTAGSLPTGLTLSGSGLLSGVPSAEGSFSFTVTATDSTTATGGQDYTVFAYTTASQIFFYTVVPCRLIDTRLPVGTWGGPALAGAGAQRVFPVAGQCGVPAGAAAVAINVTAVNAPAGGDLRLFPTGTPTPTVSSINFRAARTRANGAILSLTGLSAGSLTVQCDMPGGTMNFLLDIVGYFM